MGIKMIASTQYGQATYIIDKIGDVGLLQKKGLITGSVAMLYLSNGDIRIWNFIANEDPSLDGSWVEMV